MTKKLSSNTRKTGHVYLIGFSGSGKSTIGPLLARRLHRRYVDSDKLIEKSAGMTIIFMFATRGEPFFRYMEHRVVKELASLDTPRVVALGGGTFEDERNRKLIEKSGITIYLRTNMRELYARLRYKSDRPLLAVPAWKEAVHRAKLRAMAALLEKRKAQYQTADIIVSTSRKTPAEVVEEIIEKLQRYYADH